MRFHKKQNNTGFAARTPAIALFCLLFLSLNIFARTLNEYHADVKSAQTHTQELLEYAGAVSEGERLRDAGYERTVLGNIRKTLPATEKVEWEGTIVETGNQWLEAKLKAFEETGDLAKGAAILTEVSERLAAIDEELNRLQAATASNRSKDEDKRKLAEILRRPEYQPQQQQESWFQRLQRRIREWFREKFPRPDIPDSAPRGFESLSFGLQILLYAVVLGFVGFLIYRFAPFFAERFRRREREEKGERVILGEKLAANEDSQTLFDEAEALARAGNLRGAIRKGYIAFLCELSDRRIIGLAQHKTNRDYLRDVRRKNELYQNMSGLTSSFERHWYGFETADDADWQEFKRNYQKAVSETH